MAGTQIVAVGTYGSPETHNVRLLEINGHGNSVRQLSAISAGINPSYVCPSADGKLLYIINEKNRNRDDGFGTLRTYSLNRADWELTLESEMETKGDGPCFVMEEAGGKFMVAVNYSSGSITVFEKGPDGVPVGIVHKTLLMGFGPNRKRQSGAHPHWAVNSPDGKYLYIPDLGSDRIWIFTVPADGRLRAADIPAVIMKPGSGPRSLVFSPETGTACCLNELSSTLVQFKYDPKTGMLHRHDEVSTLPEGFSGPNLAAEIQVNGNTVIASNRGHDTLMEIHLESDGFRKDAVWIESGGVYPRSFAVCPDPEGDGGCMIVGNQDSGVVTVFDMVPMGAWPVRELKIPLPSSIRVIPPISNEEQPKVHDTVTD